MKISRKLNNKGFTIVETLIVLAIAAVILIIVLLAIPAFLRSAKNATAKNDATTVAGAVSDFVATSGGLAPNVTQCVGPNYDNCTTPGQFWMCYNSQNGNYVINPMTLCTATATNYGSYYTSTPTTFSTSSSESVWPGPNALTTLTTSLTSSTWNAGSGWVSFQISPGNLLVNFSATCSSTSSAVVTYPATATNPTIAAASTEAAVLYTVETSSNSFSVWCIDG